MKGLAPNSKNEEGPKQSEASEYNNTETTKMKAARAACCTAQTGANPFLSHAARWWNLWRLQGQREESGEKREERRDKKEKEFLFFVRCGRGVSQG